MCEHAPNREAAMVVTHRKPDGTPRVWCDPCIAPIVRALNDGGLSTVASCCGHGGRPGSIVLADGRELVLGRDMDRAERAEAALEKVRALVEEWGGLVSDDDHYALWKRFRAAIGGTP